MDAYYSPEQGSESSIYARLGYYLEQIDAFDAGFFRLPKSEALLLDPHARMLLENTQVHLHLPSKIIDMTVIYCIMLLDDSNLTPRVLKHL